MPRKLMITVDVEAQTHRATDRHVDRLIWGEFPEGRAGISEMMDVADRRGAKMTMFLDWAETDARGEAIDDVGREIHRRGHDLQLHVHSDYFSKEFWDRNGVSYQINLNILSEKQADAIADEITARQISATGKAPLAFRGGGYRYSANLLNSLRRNGVLLDTSVNVSRATQPVDLSLSRQFRWSNGMIEVPVSNVAKYRNCPRPLDFNFNTAYFPNVGRMYEYLDNFWSERGDDAVAVLVMHSWSLLKLHDDGIFRHDGGQNIKRFMAFLDGLGKDVEFVTATDMIALAEKGALPIDPAVDLDAFEEARLRREEAGKGPKIAYTASSSVVTQAGYTSLSCPICGAGKKRFVQMNGRKCPDCGSVERQRCFAIAYENGIRQQFDVAGRDVLIFSPAVSELRFLNAQGIAAKESADIRPEMKPDMLLDMCAMPSVKDNSRGFVFASYLMPVVHDMEAALDEVQRVLAPGGAFISIEPLQADGSTRQITDRGDQAAWYGEETLEKYKVGSYRTLGEADYLAELERRFTVERFTARDPITGQVNHTHLCWSRKRVDPLRKLLNAGLKRRPEPPSSTRKTDHVAETASKKEIHAAAEALWADQGNAENQKQSVELFHRLFELGDKVRAGYRLGAAYYQGHGVACDLEKAYAFLSIPELDNIRFALYFRGLVLKDPRFSGRDEARALEALKQAHEMGVKAAAAHLPEPAAAADPQVPAANGTVPSKAPAETRMKNERAADALVEALSRPSGMEKAGRQPPRASVPERAPASASSLRTVGEELPANCPICDSAKADFVQLNGRKCPGCGSLERQRSFALAYDAEISRHFDVRGRHVLIFSPAASELRFLKDRGVSGRTSVDIRPESRPDIVADVCSMPAIGDASQEFVFASYLMPVVHDMEAALGEIRRVLKPDGAFISCEPVQTGRPTRETTDPEAISRWYGKETFDKYKVGSFRTLGDVDYLETLQKFFDVRCFKAIDPITKKEDVIHLCLPREQSD